MMICEQKKKTSFLSMTAAFCLFLQAGIHGGVSGADDEKKKPPYDPTSAYEIRKIEGWNV